MRCSPVGSFMVKIRSQHDLLGQVWLKHSNQPNKTSNGYYWNEMKFDADYILYSGTGTGTGWLTPYPILPTMGHYSKVTYTVCPVTWWNRLSHLPKMLTCLRDCIGLSIWTKTAFNWKSSSFLFAGFQTNVLSTGVRGGRGLGHSIR